MDKIIVTDNAFLWYLVTQEEAEQAYNNDVEVYELHDNGAESLINSLNEIELVINVGNRLAVELGFSDELKSDWLEVSSRSNETRSFDSWLLDKAENLIY